MEPKFSAPSKKMRLVLLPALLTAISAAAFAQNSTSPRVETVVVTGARATDGEKGPVCGLQLLNMVPIQINNNVMTVEADVNGKTRSFQFATATIANQMTEAAARSLGLTVGNMAGPRALTGNVAAIMGSYGFSNSGRFAPGIDGAANLGDVAAVEIYDAKGNGYANTVKVDSLSMQAILIKDVEFHVTPFPPPNVDGVLDISLFQHFDIDLNFAARRLNFFSADHCSGKILYWRAPGVAAVPYVTRDNHILVHVMLEGKELTAVIDTASPISAVSFDAAAGLFGVTPDATGLTLVGEHHGNSRQDTYAYAFKSLSFGTVAIINPHLLLAGDILPVGANPNANTGSRVQSDATQARAQPDMVIGMDLLKLTHLYIAQHEAVLYITQGPELAADSLQALPLIPVTPFRP